MTVLEEIVAKAEKLPLDQFLQLRKKLDRLEEAIWKQESQEAGAELKAAGVTDLDIDQMVMRRRRECRR